VVKGALEYIKTLRRRWALAKQKGQNWEGYIIEGGDFLGRGQEEMNVGKNGIRAKVREKNTSILCFESSVTSLPLKEGGGAKASQELAGWGFCTDGSQ